MTRNQTNAVNARSSHFALTNIAIDWSCKQADGWRRSPTTLHTPAESSVSKPCCRARISARRSAIARDHHAVEVGCEVESPSRHSAHFRPYHCRTCRYVVYGRSIAHVKHDHRSVTSISCCPTCSRVHTLGDRQMSVMPGTNAAPRMRWTRSPAGEVQRLASPRRGAPRRARTSRPEAVVPHTLDHRRASARERRQQLHRRPCG